MPVKLSTTVNKIPLIVNSTNVALIKEFYEYLKNTTKYMEDGEYLSKHRIELDSVLTKVGAKALWEYVEHHLLETFSEGRDYNRVISNVKPTHYNGNSFPYAINVIFHYLEGLYGTITADKWAKVEKDLEAVTG